jgi:vacuolar-type H+-ATPase subunit F/Vma7
VSSGGITVVGESDDLPGFRLGGVKNVVLVNKGNAEEVFEKIRESKGLVILTRKAETLLGEKAKLLESQDRMLHVLGEKGGGEYATIDRILRKTIGFDLKKKRNG